MRDARCGMGGVVGPHPASPIPHPVHSYLNASTGSSLAARPAGTTPKISPIAIETAHGLIFGVRSEEHTSELQSRLHLVCRLLLEKKKKRHGTQASVGLANIYRPRTAAGQA